MNASDILKEGMSLEEKLEAIEKAMQEATEKAKDEAKRLGQQFIPVDPADLTICEGCT